MFDQYSYKTKFKALMAVSLLLGAAAYKRSFGPLKDVISEYVSLSEKVSEMQNKTQSKEDIEKEIHVLDRMIGKQRIGKEKVQQDIVAFISAHNSGVSVSDLKEAHEFRDSEYLIYTYQADLTGSFNNLLKISYDFEKQFEDSKIVGLSFYTEKKNNIAEKLHLKIIFQNYESLH